MTKIIKLGKVVISEDEVLITGFEFDCNNGKDMSPGFLALAFALNRLSDEMSLNLTEYMKTSGEN